MGHCIHPVTSYRQTNIRCISNGYRSCLHYQSPDASFAGSYICCIHFLEYRLALSLSGSLCLPTWDEGPSYYALFQWAVRKDGSQNRPFSWGPDCTSRYCSLGWFAFLRSDILAQWSWPSVASVVCLPGSSCSKVD